MCAVIWFGALHSLPMESNKLSYRSITSLHCQENGMDVHPAKCKCSIARPWRLRAPPLTHVSLASNASGLNNGRCWHDPNAWDSCANRLRYSFFLFKLYHSTVRYIINPSTFPPQLQYICQLQTSFGAPSCHPLLHIWSDANVP